MQPDSYPLSGSGCRKSPYVIFFRTTFDKVKASSVVEEVARRNAA